jgi:hypothetical protein
MRNIKLNQSENISLNMTMTIPNDAEDELARPLSGEDVEVVSSDNMYGYWGAADEEKKDSCLYNFPAESFLEAAKSVEDKPSFPHGLINKLAKLSSKVLSAEELYNSTEKRKLMMGVHLALNNSGLLAPAFRNYSGERLTKSGIGSEKLTPAQSQLNNDLLFIDLHWVICRRLSEEPSQSFNFDEFEVVKSGVVDLAVLSDYASFKRSYSNKVYDVGISDFEQVQLRTLQSAKIKNRIRNILKKAKAVKGGIRNAISRPRCHVDTKMTESYFKQWNLLTLTQGSSREAARLEQYQTGAHYESKEELDRRSAYYRQQKRWFQKTLSLKFVATNSSN